MGELASLAQTLVTGHFFGDTDMSLTKEDAEICESLGISPAQFLANKASGARAALTTQRGSGAVYATGKLNADEMAVCDSLGVSEDDYLASKDGAAQAVLAAHNRHKPTATLNAEEVAVCRALGLTATEFIAAREARHA